MSETLRPWQVRAIAAALFLGTCALLLGTLGMGFSRDEGFYFRYGRGYAEWFARLDAAATAEEVHRVLARDQVVGTWIGNFEHPPLMKSAFGASWRHLARKDRKLVARAARGAGAATSPLAELRVVGLAEADGLAPGARAWLLAPLRVGQDPDDTARRLGRGEVVERTPRGATLALLEGDAAALVEACGRQPGDGGSPPLMTPCQAREARPLALLRESTAMRLPAIVTAGLAVALTFLLGVATVGWLPGLFAALAFLFVPRHFYHAHLCAFDMPIVAGVLATLYAFWRARDDRRWALAAGIAWGIALLVKHNAFFLPAPLLAWWLWTGRRRLTLRRDGLRVRVGLPPLPLALLVMPVVALPMLFVFWPKLWFDPFRAVADYFAFHLHHDHYMQWYFGRPLEVPPFPVEYPFVLTALTVPEAFLALILLGLVIVPWVRRRARLGPDAVYPFLLLNGLFPIVLIALPSTPIFGGVKHWMTGMPFLLLLGGQALLLLLRPALAPLRRPALRAAVTAAVGLLLLLPAARESVAAAPFGTAYYNPLVAGGVQGAADLRMMRLYWGYTSRQALPWLNEHAAPRARVFFQNTTGDAVDMYRRDGLLRHDLRHHFPEEGADLALIEPQKAFGELDIRIRRDLGVAGPVREVTFRGVPMLRVYQRPAPPPPAAAPPPSSAAPPAAGPPRRAPPRLVAPPRRAAPSPGPPRGGAPPPDPLRGGAPSPTSPRSPAPDR